MAYNPLERAKTLRQHDHYRRLDCLILSGKILLLEMTLLEMKQSEAWRMQPRAPAGSPDGGQWIDAGWRAQVTAAVLAAAKIISRISKLIVQAMGVAPLPIISPPPPLLVGDDHFRWESSLRRPYMPYLEFESYPAFWFVLGSAGKGYEWHHLVEQRMLGVFPGRSINNTDNIVRVTVKEHRCINRRYARQRHFIDGTYRTMRQYLNDKVWSEHYSRGLEELKACRIIERRSRRNVR